MGAAAKGAGEKIIIVVITAPVTLLIVLLLGHVYKLSKVAR
jgi:hypothetical protein